MRILFLFHPFSDKDTQVHLYQLVKCDMRLWSSYRTEAMERAIDLGSTYVCRRRSTKHSAVRPLVTSMLNAASGSILGSTTGKKGSLYDVTVSADLGECDAFMSREQGTKSNTSPFRKVLAH